jgi:hypothetical protein
MERAPPVNLYDMERACLSIYKTFEQLTSPAGGYKDLEELFSSAEIVGSGRGVAGTHPSVQHIATELHKECVITDHDQLLLRVGYAIGKAHEKDRRWDRAPLEFATLVARALPTAEACVNVTRRMVGCLLDRFYWDAKYADVARDPQRSEAHRAKFRQILELLKQHPSPYASPPPELSARKAAHQRKPPRPPPGGVVEVPGSKRTRILYR